MDIILEMIRKFEDYAFENDVRLMDCPWATIINLK